MKQPEIEAIAAIRKGLGLSRLDSRRLYLVNDGAYTWIGDRAHLTARDAKDLRAIHTMGTRPDIAHPDTVARAGAADYDSICQRTECVAASHESAGYATFRDLPDSWRDGSALGPIAPL